MSDLDWSPETPLAIRPGLHERRVGDKVFVLDSQSVMHALENDVAVTIWEALRDAPEGGLSVNAIARAIVEDFDVTLADASRDVLDFARLLHARGIVSRFD